MNLKLRFKNKAVLIAIATAAVAFVYQILGIIGIVPPVSQEAVIQFIGVIFNILVGLGILVDPTTNGIGDSARALTYEEPSKVTIADESFPVGGEASGNDEIAHEEDDPEDSEE